MVERETLLQISQTMIYDGFMDGIWQLEFSTNAGTKFSVLGTYRDMKLVFDRWQEWRGSARNHKMAVLEVVGESDSHDRARCEHHVLMESIDAMSLVKLY